MRSLRWKTRYATGNPGVDKRNRAFVACLNSLLEGVRQHEHCREIEELMTELVSQAESRLASGNTEDLPALIHDRLMTFLPLATRGSPACQDCGVCDLVARRVAEHLSPAVKCLALAGEVEAGRE